MKKFIYSSLILACFLAQSGLALTSDKQLPANFTADNVTYNIKTGTRIFIGNVKMTQGTTHLEGDKVTVYNGSDGKVIKVIALGKRAHYSTLPNNQKEVMDAYAETIEYYPGKGSAVLIGNGEITQGKNSFKGPHIVYDIQKELITSLASANAHTVIVLQPKDLPGGNSLDKKATQ